jgi:2-isopropylmalate synthase
LYPTSRLVSSITGIPIPRNKAVVGENAFAHEAGIHQHGMLKHHSTYEILRPEDVGLSRSHLVLGKHSGRHAFRDRVKELGFELDELEFNRVFEEFKALADKKKELFDGDIEALVLRAEGSASGPWTLLDQKTVAGGKAPPAWAVVRLQHNGDGRIVERTAEGDGPVDAAFKAIEAATGINVMLRKFEVHSVSEGEDAQGEAVVYVEYNQRTYRGSSVSTNIVESSTKAFLEVINRIELSQAGTRSREERSSGAQPAKAAV